jgi:Cu+-exporting ATPase
MGILFKNSEALETAHRLNMIMFDKTGTITRGEPVLTDWHPFNEGENQALALAASAEQGSEHPIAKAIVEGAKQRGLDIVDFSDFKAVSGLGVESMVSGHKVRVGKPDWFYKEEHFPDHASKLVKDTSSQGKTVMLVEVDEKPAGILALSDEEKQGSRDLITELRGMDIKAVLLTGDNEQAANSIAQKVGIDKVMANILPDQKEEIIRNAHDNGDTVAMVGDGINDAPALARADVGIAIGSGTDVAMEASDITLVGKELSGVIRAIKLSKATMRTIKQNLFWALFYNAALVPIAAGVLYPVKWIPGIIGELHPAMAAGAMAISSVTVVLNSLRLGKSNI